MHPASYYREQAAHARRMAGLMHQRDINEMLRRMAQDFEDIACDLETGVGINGLDHAPQLAAGLSSCGHEGRGCRPDPRAASGHFRGGPVGINRLDHAPQLAAGPWLPT